MALNKQMWLTEIEKSLYDSNSFMNFMVSHNQYVTYNTVHVPQQGSLSAKRNAVWSDYPLTISGRTDTELTYQMDKVTVGPLTVDYTEQTEFSFDKRSDLTAQITERANQENGDIVLEKLTPADNTNSNVFFTTGAATTDLDATQTGSRKKTTFADWVKIKKQFTKDKISGEFYALVDPDVFYRDILTLSEYTNSDMLTDKTVQDAVMGRLAGINIIVRNNPIYFDASGVTRYDLDASLDAAKASKCTLFWNSKTVANAVGSSQLVVGAAPEYESPALATYTVRVGATPLKENGVGYAVLVETIV